MDDQQLATVIKRCQEGEPSAFEWIVQAYGPSIFAFLLRMTRRRHLAEDLLQDTFVRAIGSIGRYDHRDRFSAWLFRIAANLVRDHVRRMQRRASTVSGDAAEDDREGALNRIPSAAADPGDRLDTDEDVGRLHTALAALTPEYREVILLRHYSQLSFKEIAELLDCPLGTALARMHRGLARLRELMGAEPRTGPAAKKPKRKSRGNQG